MTMKEVKTVIVPIEEVKDALELQYDIARESYDLSAILGCDYYESHMTIYRGDMYDASDILDEDGGYEDMVYYTLCQYLQDILPDDVMYVILTHKRALPWEALKNVSC